MGNLQKDEQRARGGTNEQMDKRTNVPLYSTGHRPLLGRCPKRAQNGNKRSP